MTRQLIALSTAVLLALVEWTPGDAEASEPTPTAQANKAQASAEGAQADQKETSETATTEPVELIERSKFFANPDHSRVRISPGGDKLSYLANEQGVLNVWVAPRNNLNEARVATHDRGRGIHFYYWAYTNDHILYLQDKGGDENWTVYSMDLGSGEKTRLTPAKGVHAQIQQLSPKHPEEILVAINERNKRLHDVYRVNITNGERALVQKNTGFTEFVTDQDFNIRLGIKMTEAGGECIMRKTPEGEWEELTKISLADQLSTQPIGFDRSGNTLYWYDSRGRNTAALVAHELATGDKEVLYADPKADVQDVSFDPKTQRPQAAASIYRRKRWQAVGDAIASDIERLRQADDGELSIIDRSLDDTHWIVGYDLSAHPYRYYHYDREADRVNFLFTKRSALRDKPLAPMHDMVIESDDGLGLVSYLTLPPWMDNDGDGRPHQRLPMVLFVHGGPWARDDWGYHPYHQWLANRGYAVLSVNYRGSAGFGKKFLNAGDKEWAGAMHDDLIDGVQWAIDERVADTDRIAIMGRSYGGYAALVGLAFTPDRFACGVDLVGPSNLITLLESIPLYWKPQMMMFIHRVGDLNTQEGRALLRARSPLTHVDRINDPLLIGQGANDPRVKPAESEQIVNALKDRNVPVTYLYYPDEGHRLTQPENRLSFNAVAESFLAECIDGRHQAFGDALEGSSMQVKAGTGYVPGLRSALERAPKERTDATGTRSARERARMAEAVHIGYRLVNLR
jgi:dipeptidyl aminopeptidase/acylaminoacyl peptidase